MSLSANPSRRRLSPCEGERGQSFQIGSKRKGDLGYTMGTQKRKDLLDNGRKRRSVTSQLTAVTAARRGWRETSEISSDFRVPVDLARSPD